MDAVWNRAGGPLGGKHMRAAFFQHAELMDALGYFCCKARACCRQPETFLLTNSGMARVLWACLTQLRGGTPPNSVFWAIKSSFSASSRSPVSEDPILYSPFISDSCPLQGWCWTLMHFHPCTVLHLWKARFKPYPHIQAERWIFSLFLDF